MEIVSRRTPIAFSICRSDHPSRPSAIACCFFSSFKTLLTRTEDNFPPSPQCPESLCLAGFQVITPGRFWVFTEVLLGLLQRGQHSRVVCAGVVSKDDDEIGAL